MCVVGLWAEVEMDKRITDHDGKINGFLKVVFHNNSSAVSYSIIMFKYSIICYVVV